MQIVPKTLAAMPKLYPKSTVIYSVSVQQLMWSCTLKFVLDAVSSLKLDSLVRF